MALISVWCAVRVVLWETPFATRLVAAARGAARMAAPRAEPGIAPGTGDHPEYATASSLDRKEARLRPQEPALAAAALTPGWRLATAAAFKGVSPRSAGSKVLLLAAAFSKLEIPTGLIALVPQARAVPAAIPAFPQLAGDTARASPGRWSGDAWVLWRRDTVSAVTSGRGSYGRSQAGAVLRYRLAPSSPLRPTAYVRVSAALLGADEGEIAVGFAGRPLPRVPIGLAAEVRGSRFEESSEARPAVFAFSEFPPLKLPLGGRGEAYFQGGYVGGRFATAFIDGQVRLERQVARLGSAELRAGGGAWGGAQKGAARLDVGPAASVALDLAGAPLRMSADWRFRLAGEANPSSGPALTVSAGF